MGKKIFLGWRKTWSVFSKSAKQRTKSIIAKMVKVCNSKGGIHMTTKLNSHFESFDSQGVSNISFKVWGVKHCPNWTFSLQMFFLEKHYNKMWSHFHKKSFISWITIIWMVWELNHQSDLWPFKWQFGGSNHFD